ncbi:MAG TPA: MATE family efflux transporter [Candidatus Binatia bacterium]|nr:MATE family efflux transporter [Candidatus Binatia bacterium]
MTVTAEAADPPHSHLKDILRLAVPAMLALASQPLMSIGDTAMIGHLGAESLAARAVGAAIIGGIYWIFAFLSFGTTTLVGYHHGAQDFRACGETYLNALFVALLGGVGIACAGLIFATPLYRLMGAGPNVIEEGVPYFCIYITSAPLTFIFFASVGLFRGIQNTKTPMLIAFVVTMIHLLLDYGLIYGHFGLPRLGLKGAAMAAFVGQLVGAAACLGIFFFSRSMAAYRAAKWRVSLSRLRPLFRIGGDLAIRTGALRGSLVFATSRAARMGADVLSAHEIAFQLMLLGSEVIDGLAVAGQALVAKYLGAAQKEKAIAMGKTLILCGAVAGFIFGIAFLGAQDAIAGFFTNSTDVKLLLGAGVILLVAVFQPLNGIVFVLDGFLIGARDTRFLMWAMLIGALGIFVPISWMSLHSGWGLIGIWAGVGALMSWRLVTLLYRFFSRSWYASSGVSG